MQVDQFMPATSNSDSDWEQSGHFRPNRVTTFGRRLLVNVRRPEAVDSDFSGGSSDANLVEAQEERLYRGTEAYLGKAGAIRAYLLFLGYCLSHRQRGADASISGLGDFTPVRTCQDTLTQPLM